MIRKSFFILPELWDKAAKAGKEIGTTASGFIRIAIIEKLKKSKN